MASNNGTLKKWVIGVATAILAWFAVDYITLRTDVAVAKANYENILKTLEKMDKKLDRLDPDMGPPSR